MLCSPTRAFRRVSIWYPCPAGRPVFARVLWACLHPPVAVSACTLTSARQSSRWRWCAAASVLTRRKTVSKCTARPFFSIYTPLYSWSVLITPQIFLIRLTLRLFHAACIFPNLKKYVPCYNRKFIYTRTVVGNRSEGSWRINFVVDTWNEGERERERERHAHTHIHIHTQIVKRERHVHVDLCQWQIGAKKSLIRFVSLRIIYP